MVNNFAQTWKDKYSSSNSDINFVAGDFDTLKEAIRSYVVAHNPENYNDWAESSEVGMFVNGLAYLGESLHYRVDLNAHDNFPSTTERRQSLLNFAKMLSYAPKRNICANGLAKIVSVTTTQNISDASGNILKDVPILWNDASNPNWLEQFLTVMNASFVHNNPFGKPIKKDVVEAVTTQLYQMNTVPISNSVFSFGAYVNTIQQQFEVVNPDIDLSLNVIYERHPISEQAFNMIYRNDGTGNVSSNTGFFVFWKQGSLKNKLQLFSEKIENNSIAIEESNINEYDVWVSELDTSSGITKKVWTRIKNTEYLVYNNTDSSIRDIFKVETREDDRVTIRFSDGNFGSIPLGVYKVWYRTSQGNDNLFIKPTDIKNIPIRIPYKSNNSTDDNIYYLTVVISVEDTSHINQSTVQESIENIRERAPEVYSTQNRMVTGSDYNIFPLTFGQQIKVCKSLVRTYSGNSRYVKFNDPTGTYQDLTLLAEDGFLYKSDRIYTTEEPIDSILTPREIIIKNINPLLNSTSLFNFYYNYYPSFNIHSVISSSIQEVIWSELYSEGSNMSVGRCVDKTGKIIEQSEIQRFITAGNMICFKNVDDNTEKWVRIERFIPSTVDNISYEITINEVLSRDNNWEATQGYTKFTNSLSANVYTQLESLIEQKTSFGITYNQFTTEWEVITSKNLSEDNVPFNFDSPIAEDNTYRNWIIKVQYESSGYWIFKIRYLDYIFGSESKISFFFNTEEKLNNTNFSTNDYIKVLKLNNTTEAFKQDYFWKPCETIKYSDGYVDPQKVKVYGYDIDKDNSVDNPIQFQEIMNGESKELFFLTSNDSYDSFIPNVQNVPSLWEYVSKSGTYFCEVSGTVFPRGSKLPKSVTITKSVRLSNGTYLFASPTNPHTFSMGDRFDYDVVDDGWVVTWKWKSDSDPSISSNEDVLLEFDEYPVGEELVTWNATDDKLVRYSTSDYIRKEGINNLNFIWRKYASSKYIIDPCPTNIIDIFVLTTEYFNEVANWLLNNKKGDFPKLPSSYELKAIFKELENYNMVSDSVVWHPVKYKLLFGEESDSEFRANFKVIKGTTAMSDNEIKQTVVESIDEFFANMEVGETFFFTKLTSYIDSKLGDNIGTVLLVPSYSDEKFGNLFEIYCEDDEILLSSATIDNVQIIDKITDHNIRIGS